jgi:hypothetical protein
MVKEILKRWGADFNGRAWLRRTGWPVAYAVHARPG